MVFIQIDTRALIDAHPFISDILAYKIGENLRFFSSIKNAWISDEQSLYVDVFEVESSLPFCTNPIHCSHPVGIYLNEYCSAVVYHHHVFLLFTVILRITQMSDWLEEGVFC